MSLIGIDGRGGNETVARMGRLIDGYPKVTREGLEDAASEGVRLAQDAAPYQDGTLRDSVEMRRISDTQVSYGTSNPIGLYLDRPVTRDPHYRTTSRRGQPTEGWFSRTREQVERYLANEVVPKVARAIRELWR